MALPNHTGHVRQVYATHTVAAMFQRSIAMKQLLSL
jgi:hypothetical protein